MNQDFLNWAFGIFNLVLGGFVSSGVMTSSGTNLPLYYSLAFIQKT
jgi:hypothetical protein